MKLIILGDGGYLRVGEAQAFIVFQVGPENLYTNIFFPFVLIYSSNIKLLQKTQW